MEWSPEQDGALSAVQKWLDDRSGPRIFRLFGYAGTGKTTLARHFAEHVDGHTAFCAYTGKAASVLRSKGCAGASTIHSLIYNPHDRSRLRLSQLEREAAELLVIREESGLSEVQQQHLNLLQRGMEEERRRLSQPAFALKEDSSVESAALIVVDECSMVDSRLGQDLLSFGVKTLVLGDPAQLPPVANDAGFFTEHTPDVMLREIHRQARDNPIIHLATRARQERSLSPGTYGSSRVMQRGDPLGDLPLAADQMLVGRNKTRHRFNARVRSLLGYSGEIPEPGERVICLRNHHDVGLLNGSMWTVRDVGASAADRFYMSVDSHDLDIKDLAVEAWTGTFGPGRLELPWWERRDAEEFDFGYAVTVHKAQGSQWGSVLLFDESGAFRRDRWRWLYTGITRAADSVFIYPM